MDYNSGVSLSTIYFIFYYCFCAIASASRHCFRTQIKSYIEFIYNDRIEQNEHLCSERARKFELCCYTIYVCKFWINELTVKRVGAMHAKPCPRYLPAHLVRMPICCWDLPIVVLRSIQFVCFKWREVFPLFLLEILTRSLLHYSYTFDRKIKW